MSSEHPEARRVIGIFDLAYAKESERNYTEVFFEALEAGCKVCLLRVKAASLPDVASQPWSEMIAAASSVGATILVHESLRAVRPDLAEGRPVHLGANCLSQDEIVPSVQGFGVSTHSRDEVLRARALGASWIFVSPFALSVSKAGYGPVLGTQGVQELASLAQCPTFALAGVRAETVIGLGRTGAAGVALLGMLYQSDLKQQWAALLEAMEKESWVHPIAWS